MIPTLHLGQLGQRIVGGGAQPSLWDVTITTNLSYSDGGKTVAGTSATAATTRVPLALGASAKVYFEFVIPSIAGSSDPPQIGVCNKVGLPTFLAGDSGSWCYLLSRGWTWGPTISYATGKPTFSASNRGMVAIDRAANKIWYGKAGSWIGGGDPAAGTSPDASNLSGTLHVAATVDNNCSVTLHSLPADWSYTPPSGFGPM